MHVCNMCVCVCMCVGVVVLVASCMFVICAYVHVRVCVCARACMYVFSSCIYISGTVLRFLKLHMAYTNVLRKEREKSAYMEQSFLHPCQVCKAAIRLSPKLPAFPPNDLLRSPTQGPPIPCHWVLSWFFSPPIFAYGLCITTWNMYICVCIYIYI